MKKLFLMTCILSLALVSSFVNPAIIGTAHAETTTKIDQGSIITDQYGVATSLAAYMALGYGMGYAICHYLYGPEPESLDPINKIDATDFKQFDN